MNSDASGARMIRVRGARVHNLRNVDVDIPRNRLVALTGVSGSGKSSLAFDTLFAEGQRRYLESLSTYTRQYLQLLERPDADRIDGLPPTISIDQRAGTVQPRSTLATTTELYDYLRLLYARAGQAHCPQCGQPVSRQSRQAIVDRILTLEERQKVMILAPLVQGRKGTHRRVFERICKEGFVRARVDGQIVDAASPPELARSRVHDVEVVVDRIIVKPGIQQRLQDSVELALKQGDGVCLISREEKGNWHDSLYSEKFACARCGSSFPDLEMRSFSFNSPYGACRECDGLGVIVTGDAGTQTPDPPADRACPSCAGSRLNPFSRAVTIDGKPIHELTRLTVAQAASFCDRLAARDDKSGDGPFTPDARAVAGRILPDVRARLAFLCRVGLDYLTLDRPTQTLSGGEFQRARLAACLGSGLIGVCYVLDEPTIGLHPRDTRRLHETLVDLREQGNSVLIVEHDLDTIRRADYVVDLGPGPGRDGGEVVAAGTVDVVSRNPRSITGRYLQRGAARAPLRRAQEIDSSRQLILQGARTHNLKQVTAGFPLNKLTCVTGVSGSGKSSLVVDTLVPAVRCALSESGHRRMPATYDALEGSQWVQRLVEVDRSPIGRSGRSNPATYSGIWEEVRRIYAKTRAARIRGFKPRRFSFNARDGRCPTCKGQGTRRIEMHFMPDMYVACPDCKGARFNRQTLAVRFAGKNLADVLAMRIDEALDFFSRFPKLRSILETFVDVGLGYLGLGQSSLSLSGGEAQRVKLATELGRAGTGSTLFVLDEPTTGLHPDDVARLIALLDRLVERGHTVIVIEHQLDVVAAADWMIDLGPEGGEGGGRIMVEGPPADVADPQGTPTQHSLFAHLNGNDG